MRDGRPGYGIVGQEHLHAAVGELGLEPGLRRHAGGECAGNAFEIVGYEVAAVTVWADTNELDAGIERAQGSEQILQRAQGRTRRGMHAESARQPHAGRLELFAANHSCRADGISTMARIVF